MSKRTWTDEKLKRLVLLRDGKRMKWKAIGAAFGVDGALCCTKYHLYKANLRIAERRKQLSAAPPPPIVFTPADPDKRYFQDADADLRLRIARQGLTAGVFGDPPAGRSALDQRERAK